jgi:hypothetical protein
MSRIRFATAHALLEAFPDDLQKFSVPPAEQSPINYLKVLSAECKLADALTFCAFLLPRREAVWWACRSARTLLGDIARGRAVELTAAETWVYQPDETHRLAALEIGSKGDGENPLTWLARAAGWCGGTWSPAPNVTIPSAPVMTPRAIRVAMLLSASKLPEPDRTTRVQACIAEGIKLAENGLS